MDQTVRNKLRETVLSARDLLEKALREELQGRYGIYISNTAGRNASSLTIEEETKMGHLEPDELETRRLLLGHLDVLKASGLSGPSALDAFVRETAFTWLNRFVAFKMMEARGLIRETVSRLEDSNGFKMWLVEAGNENNLADYEKGDLPQNGRGEGPRQQAYRAFILAQCRKLSAEVRVLFDPDAIINRFLPQPRALRELMNLLNSPDLTPAWEPGNEETIGWVYQGFNELDKKNLFSRLYREKHKVQPEEIPVATQIFTPRWIVRFLVENTLGRLWIEMHPDSKLAPLWGYLVPLSADRPPSPTIKSVKEITLLDPACGTMHFGLVAFDLFVEMYREEMQKAGQPGWPAKPPVTSEEEIPAVILANNLHGIDIDLRAVQLSALALYLKAKTLNPRAKLTESRLTCANIHMLDGDNLKDFMERMNLGPIYRRILTTLQSRLKDSEQLGSLLRLEDEIRELVDEERRRYDREGRQISIPGFAEQQFETEANRHEFWERLEREIGQKLDAFAREHGNAAEQTFFAGETTKALRLLELMTQRYDVVVTNPPYMTSRNMNQTLKNLVGKQYPVAKGDLYACFIYRCNEWLAKQGRLGMVCQQSFMFISTYEKLREYLRSNLAIEVVPHVGPRAFEEVTGEKVNTVLFVLRHEEDPEARQNAVGTYFRLVKEPDSESKQRRFEKALANLRTGKDDPIVYRYRQGDFDAIPGSPWVYWITPGLRKVFETFPKLGEIAQPRQGLATADNFRFLRYWWEAGTERIGFGCTSAEEAMKTGKRWFPYMKGGVFRRWYGNQDYVVNWERDGEEIKNFADPSTGKTYSRPQNTDYYFRRGVTWSLTSSKGFACRISSGGFIFDVNGMTCFPAQHDLFKILGLLNSEVVETLVGYINPTIANQVGDLARLPVPKASSDKLCELVDRAVILAKADSEDDETTWDYIAPPDWPDGIQKVAERHAQLAEIERQIDEEVYRLYGISDEDRRAIEAELATGGATAENEDDEEPGDADAEETATTETSWSKEDLAKSWINYAVGVVMGQFEPVKENGLGRGRFDKATAAQLRELKDADGLLVVDSGHPDDLAAKVLAALEVIFGEVEAESLIRHALADNGEPLAMLRSYLADKFFREHIQKYRKRPIYWYLRSSRGNYGLWLYYHRLDKDILFKALMNYVEPKIRLEEDRLNTLRARKQNGGTSGRVAKEIEREIDRLEQFVSELRDFAEKLRRAADLRLDFDLNDGVILNMAPLWELIPWNEPKKYWEELQEGKYDWAHIAYQLWPERVKEKCRKDRSLAIAHGLEEFYDLQSTNTERKVKRGRKKNIS